MTGLEYDVVVVGGGAAGLSGALTLARTRRSVLVVDAGAPRNAPADGVHNYLGREGTPPSELTAIGRSEVEGYGAEVRQGTVVSAEPLEPVFGGPEVPGFSVRLADGDTVRARRLLVTTGVRDELPDLPGLAERWGRDVHHCPFCHGWEVRDQALGILGSGAFAVHTALLWRGWSDDVTLFLHTADEPTSEEQEQLEARGISVVTGDVSGLEVTDDALTGVRLADGRTVARDALVVTTRTVADDGFLAELGLKAVDAERGGHVVGTHVPADPMGATEVPGVYVAGNVADPFAQVVVSAAGSSMAAAAITADLLAEDTACAVAARRDVRAREAVSA